MLASDERVAVRKVEGWRGGEGRRGRGGGLDGENNQSVMFLVFPRDEVSRRATGRTKPPLACVGVDYPVQNGKAKKSFTNSK